MAQTWDPDAYAQNAGFVHGLAGGVVEWLAPQAGERILDLGCGDGQLTERLAQLSPEWMQIRAWLKQPSRAV